MRDRFCCRSYLVQNACFAYQLDLALALTSCSDQAMTAPSATAPPLQSRHSSSNIYQSRNGSHVILHSADPMLNLDAGPSPAPFAQPSLCLDYHMTAHALPNISSVTCNTVQPDSISGPRPASQSSPEGASEAGSCASNKQGGSRRLQASVNVLKRISSGLRSPWPELNPKSGQGGKRQGYFE